MIVTEQQFEEWQDNPVTQAFMDHIERYEEFLRAQWSQFMESQVRLGADHVEHYHAAVQGKRQVLVEIREMTAEDINHDYTREGESDDE